MAVAKLVRFLLITAVAAASCNCRSASEGDVPLQQDPKAVTAAAIDRLDAEIEVFNRHFGTAHWIAETYPTRDALALRQKIEMMIEDAHVRGLSSIYLNFGSVAGKSPSARKLMHLGHRLPYPLPAERSERAILRQSLSDLAEALNDVRICHVQHCYPIAAAEVAVQRSSNLEAKVLWASLRTSAEPLVAPFLAIRKNLNQAAAEWGYADMAQWWISRYERSKDELISELDTLADEMEPLASALRCRISAGDGDAPRSTLPADTLNSLSGRSWGHLHDRARAELPPYRVLQLDVAERFQTVEEMIRWAEGTYRSAGFPPLPPGFWESSQFVRPDRDASACPRFGTNVDWHRDVRLAMCGKRSTEDLRWSHGMLAFLYYDLAFAGQDWVFRDPPHLGFHFANSAAMKLSLTPEFLHREGLLHELPTADDEMSQLLFEALELVPRIGYGILVDRWRWEVFEGDMNPGEMSRLWWQLRARYQGITGPEGSKAANEPFAHTTVVGNHELLPHAMGDVLKFQFLKEACLSAGYRGPLYKCTFYGSDAVAKRLWPILTIGASRPWYEVLEAYTGSSRISAAALLEYFEPLHRWLDDKNRERRC